MWFLQTISGRKQQSGPCWMLMVCLPSNMVCCMVLSLQFSWLRARSVCLCVADCIYPVTRSKTSRNQWVTLWWLLPSFIYSLWWKWNITGKYCGDAVEQWEVSGLEAQLTYSCHFPQRCYVYFSVRDDFPTFAIYHDKARHFKKGTFVLLFFSVCPLGR